MRGAGDDCYSGECGECSLEIEGVIDNLGGLTTETYPMDGTGPTIEFDNEDYEEFFGSHSTDEPEGEKE